MSRTRRLLLLVLSACLVVGSIGALITLRGPSHAFAANPVKSTPTPMLTQTATPTSFAYQDVFPSSC